MIRSAPAAVPLQAAFCSDAGRVRTNNEDVPIVDTIRGVYGVVDGVGGHAAGEIAASLASDVILQRLARPLGTPAERAREAIAIANNEILRRANEVPELQGMACVVTLAIVGDGTITVGHVGDSRLYLLRRGIMRKLTHDHSPVGEREDAREITEIEAMRHPRRNEVFRDVGSAYHDKDDDEFVEIVETPFDDDCAVLLCTDGLTDMISSSAIERIVRQYAGRPQEVVDALVAAANEAGGKDNVTVVYAEAPRFASTCPPVGRETVQDPPATDRRTASASSSRTPTAFSFARLGSAVVGSRTVWFGIGAVVATLAILAFGPRVTALLTPAGGRTLVVGAGVGGRFERISDAAAAAVPGDVIRVEPGIYRERIDLPDGVDLIARAPGTVTIASPASHAGESVAISLHGDSAARVVGIRIESTPDSPFDIGMRISGQGRTIQLVDLRGPMRAAVDVMSAASVSIYGGHFAVTGPALMFAERAHATVMLCSFVRSGASDDPPIWVFPSADVLFTRNLFAGPGGGELVRGLSGEALQKFRAANTVVWNEQAGR